MRIFAPLVFASVALLPSCQRAEGAHSGPHVDAAVCLLRAVGDSGVTGTLRLQAVDDGTRITGEIRGLTEGKHGFHIHEFGDVTGLDDGKTTGSHYAPRGHDHGERDASHRHVGDLGNVEANADGIAKVDLLDDQVRLTGPHSVIGRGFVVHADEDRFTQPTGDAGARVAIGVIGIAGK